MKLFIQVLMILVAALIVSGATFALSRSSFATAMGGPQRGQFERWPSAGSDGAISGEQNTAGQFDREGPPEGMRPGGRGAMGGLFGLMDVGRNLIVIALIVVAVSFFSRLARPLQARLSARRKPTPPPSTA